MIVTIETGKHLVALEGSSKGEGLTQHRPVEVQAAVLAHKDLGGWEADDLDIRGAWCGRGAVELVWDVGADDELFPAV